MRVKNGKRYTRLPKADPGPRGKLRESGESAFLDHSTPVGVSWTPCKVGSAMIRDMDSVS